MNTWLEFEARFRELSPLMQSARIDDQTGSAGEHWRIAGITLNNETVKQYELLCNLAGQQITDLNIGSNELLNHTDPKVRWYRLLKSSTASYQNGLAGYQTDDDGNNLGWLYTGTINNICEGSANLCLQLHTTNPIKPKLRETLYQDYGKQIIIGIILLFIGGLIGAWFS